MIVNPTCGCGGDIKSVACYNDSNLRPGIIMDDKCLVAYLSSTICNDSKVCYDSLLIPATESTLIKKTIPSNSIFVLKKESFNYKFVAFSIKNNGRCLYRAVSSFAHQYPYMVNYTTSFSFSLSNLSDDISKLGITCSFAPDAICKVATWQNISGMMIEGKDYSSWNKIDVEWNSMNPIFTNNGYAYPVLNNSSIYNLYYDPATNKSTNVFDVLVGDVNIGYSISMYAEYDHATGNLTIITDKIKNVNGRILSEKITIFDSNGNMSNSAVLNANNTMSYGGYMVSVGAVKYSMLHGIKVESSYDKEISDEYELFNNSGSPIDVEILLAN